MKKRLLLTAITLFIFLVTNAQVLTQYFTEKREINWTFLNGYAKPSKRIQEMPTFDLEKMQKEDEVTDTTNLPYRFGKSFDVSFILDDGEWDNVEGGRLWSMSFKSNRAKSLNFIFDKFHLPVGTELYITNTDNTVLYGPVTSAAIPKKGFFLTDIIPGDEATIYLYEPDSVRNMSSLRIKRVVHGYRTLFQEDSYGNLNTSAECQIDVACSPDYADESNAIALVLLSGGDCLCSGSLLMSTDYSFKPYFLTAFHCADLVNDSHLSESEISNAEEWMFKFFYKKKTCGGNVMTGKTYNSAILRAGWNQSDFLLMEINGNLQNDDSMFWLGWDRSGIVPSSGVCIHHPQGDIMKISTDDDTLVSSSIKGFSNNGWRARWDEGVTEGGSSGAPLLNQDKRVVGQVYGKKTEDYIEGSTPCERKNTHFGKFDMSWTGGGTNSSRLSNWLDPIGSNWMIMNSYKYSEFPHHISGSPVVCDSTQYSVDNLPNDMSVTWSINNNRFKVTPYGNQCKVTYNSTPRYDQATLSATIMKDSLTVSTFTKRIVMHGTDMYVEGIQSGIYDENGDIPAVAETFTIPASLGSRGRSNRLSTSCRDSIEMSRIPVMFENTRLLTTPENPTYGVTEIYGGAVITLIGDRFDGMTISFSGDEAPDYLSTDGSSMLEFRMPEVSSITNVQGYYYVVLHAASTGGCHDFDLYFKVVPVEGESIGDPEISLYFTDSSVRVDFDAMEWDELPNGQLQAIPWNLYIYRMAGYGNPSMTLMHSSTNYTESKTVNISNWSSGIYLVRIKSNGSVYTKKFLKQ